MTFQIFFIFEKNRKVSDDSCTFLTPLANFFLRGVEQWYFGDLLTYMGPLIRTRPHPHMCRRMADMWQEKSSTAKNGPKWGPKFGPYLGVWVTWCAWWVHILYLAPDDEMHLYRLSIHNSINSGSPVGVPTSGTCLWDTRKSPIFLQFGRKQ